MRRYAARVAAQYHFQFPTEGDALRFTRSVAWKCEDIAIRRDGAWVSIIDGAGGREQELLAMALRIHDNPLVVK